MFRGSKRRRACAVVTAGLALTAVGCGSDDGSKDTTTAGGGATKTTAAAKFTGAPIKIATVSTVDSPIGTWPGSFAGTKAAVDAINASGGINGHKLEVQTCNAKLDPSQEVACTRQAVSGGAVAMVGSLPIANPTGYQQTLKKADMADIASLALFPQSYQGANDYPIDFYPGLVYACASQGLAKLAARSTEVRAIVGGSAGEKGTIPSFKAATRTLGTTLKSPVIVPQSATDMSPFVQQAANNGDGMLTFILSPTQSTSFLSSAITSGRDWASCSPDGIPRSQRKKLGDGLSKYYLISPFPSLSQGSEFPLIDQFNKQLATLAGSGDKDAKSALENYPEQALRAWLGVQVFKQVAAKISGDVTTKGFSAAIATAKVDLGGVTPPLDFSKPVGGGIYPRVFNPMAGFSKWNPSKQSADPLPNLQPVNAVKAIG